MTWGGPEDRTSAPLQVWNHIPGGTRNRIVRMALDHADLSSRELEVNSVTSERRILRTVFRETFSSMVIFFTDQP